MKRIQVVVRNANPNEAEVLIDGEPVLVERVEIDVRGDAFPRVKITLIPDPLEVDVTIEDEDLEVVNGTTEDAGAGSAKSDL